VLTCNEEELGECSEALEVYLLWGRAVVAKFVNHIPHTSLIVP
jgi:hypothetical protein